MSYWFYVLKRVSPGHAPAMKIAAYIPGTTPGPTNTITYVWEPIYNIPGPNIQVGHARVARMNRSGAISPYILVYCAYGCGSTIVPMVNDEAFHHA